MNNYFFEILQVALGTRECLSGVPEAEDWKRIYDEAMRQTVSGICFAGLCRLNDKCPGQTDRLPRPLKMQWISLSAHIRRRNALLNDYCARLQERFASDGIRSTILKGQGVATLYGAELSQLRQSGDIDIYVDRSRKEVLDYLSESGIRVDHWDYAHAAAEFFSDAEVEVHYRYAVPIDMLRRRRFLRFWDERCEEMFSGRADLPPTVICPGEPARLLHLIYHAYRHFLDGGLGLRQIMDIYFATITRNSFKDELLLGYLAYLRLERFTAAIMWLLEAIFGMDSALSLYIADPAEGKFILDEVLITGNFGKYDTRYEGGFRQGSANGSAERSAGQVDANGFAERRAGQGRGKTRTKLQGAVRRTRRLCHSLIGHYGTDTFMTLLWSARHFFWKRGVIVKDWIRGKRN